MATPNIEVYLFLKVDSSRPKKSFLSLSKLAFRSALYSVSLSEFSHTLVSQQGQGCGCLSTASGDLCLLPSQVAFSLLALTPPRHLSHFPLQPTASLVNMLRLWETKVGQGAPLQLAKGTQIQAAF